MTPGARRCRFVALTCALATATPAFAADAAREDQQREAQRRFHAGVQLYQDGDAAAAQVEFRRAYDLAPNHRILFNLGQVAYQLHDWVSARAALERYLREGAEQIPDARRREVEQTLAIVVQRIGAIAIDGGAGEELRIDDVRVGRAPLAAAIAVNVGRRKVAWTTSSGAEVARVVDVPGGETVRVRIPARAPVIVDRPSRADAALAVRASGRETPTAQRREHLWLPWTATALLAAGGAAAAVVAARASQDLQSARDDFPASRAELDDLQHRTRVWSAVSDGLFVGAAVFAGVSLYLTLARDDEPPSPRRRAALRLTPTGIAFGGGL